MVVLRKVLNKGVLLYIHFNLFLALLMALILFVSGMETATHIKWLCATVAALLHYLFLCVFCWMLAEGILLYVLVVRAFTTNFKKWYYLLPLGWGLPLPIVAISVGLRHNYYGTPNFCWLSVQSGVTWSFIGPMLAVIMVNSVILVLTIISVVRVKRKASVDANLSGASFIVNSVKTAIVLLPLLGVTWIIGLFAVNRNTTVFAWTFTLLNSLQGTMIFALHILRNNRVRKWLLGKVGLGRIFDGKSSTKSSKLHPVSLAGRGEDTLPKSDFENHNSTSTIIQKNNSINVHQSMCNSFFSVCHILFSFGIERCHFHSFSLLLQLVRVFIHSWHIT
ncbi:Adhesion G protein-coupled receptor L3 [Geodia barretti]|uniref:Adhesion G protein-coupled receptor L3 n=1 Tax=Geodia barretti TaxID=519541 RepID=A0AA35U1J4_GEOBA|nr:Adhesion G protein-coupled receptor L3 [Geodia barretti]